MITNTISIEIAKKKKLTFSLEIVFVIFFFSKVQLNIILHIKIIQEQANR